MWICRFYIDCLPIFCYAGVQIKPFKPSYQVQKKAITSTFLQLTFGIFVISDSFRLCCATGVNDVDVPSSSSALEEFTFTTRSPDKDNELKVVNSVIFTSLKEIISEVHNLWGYLSIFYWFSKTRSYNHEATAISFPIPIGRGLPLPRGRTVILCNIFSSYICPEK